MSKESVDAAVLNELRAIMGNDFGMLIDVFIKDSIQRLEIIQQAIRTNDTENLRRAAHSLKGSAMNISAARLTELCRELEFMGRDGRLENATTLFEAVREEFDKVKSYLESV